MRNKTVCLVFLSCCLVFFTSCIFNWPSVSEGKGWASMDMGQFENAIEQFDRAIERWPEHRYDHCPPYCGKVIAYTFLEEWEEIIPVCDELVALECGELFAWPYHIDAWPYIRRGIAHINLGDFDAALVDLDAALSVPTATDLERYEAYVGKGNVLLEAGEYEKAIEEFTRAVDIGYPFESVIHELDYTFFCYYFEKDAYLLRGKAYEELGRTEDAMADYKMAGEAGVY